jgi:stress-induced morphogen
MELYNPEQVKSLLTDFFKNSHIEVIDTTGTLDHYKVMVVSDDFEGKSLVQRHQLVNLALAEPLKGPIHALSIEAYTKEEYSQKANPASPNQPKAIQF